MIAAAGTMLLALGAAAMIAGCGSSIVERPVSLSSLEGLLTVESMPVYWLGLRFEGMALTAVSEDPGGAFTLQYGNCLSGGPATCRTALELITSPQSTFLPSAGNDTKPISMRGVSGLAAQHGAVIELRTGPVVVDVRARKSRVARAAAAAIVAVNAPGSPGQRLPAARPNGSFTDEELPVQQPRTIRTLPPIPPEVGRSRSR